MEESKDTAEGSQATHDDQMLEKEVNESTKASTNSSFKELSKDELSKLDLQQQLKYQKELMANRDAKSQQKEIVKESSSKDSVDYEKILDPRFVYQKSEQITGMKCKGKGGESLGFLPLRELSLDVDIVDSIAVIKMI